MTAQVRPWHAWTLACGLVVAARGAIDPADPRWAGFDLHRYDAMRIAVPRFAMVRAPEAFRMAAPWLASQVGWRPVTYGGLCACVALLWRWLRREGLSEMGAGIGVLLFSSAHFLAGFIAWDCYQAGDALGLAALLGALCAVQARRWGAFAAIVALGCLVRETPVLAMPYALAAVPRQWRSIVPGAVAGVAVLVSLHLLVPHDGGLTLVQAVRLFGFAKLSPVVLARDVGAFGPSVLVPLVALRVTRAALRLEHVLLLAAVLATSLAGGDVERLMLPAAPVVLFLVARVAERWPTRHVAMLAGAALLGSAHHNMARWPLPSRAWTVALALLCTGVATGAAVIAERELRLQPRSP